jgi:hypothetical protein
LFDTWNRLKRLTLSFAAGPAPAMAPTGDDFMKLFILAMTDA